MSAESKKIAIVGGGPAGLRVAEILSQKGYSVELFDQKPSVGRKFLIAGRGGLNITHSEPIDSFQNRYFSLTSQLITSQWRQALELFSPTDLRRWVESFEIETYVGSSQRVYPQGDSAAKLLLAWIERLKKQGVTFSLKHRWKEFERTPFGWSLTFDTESGERQVECDSIVFAMGGGSWTETGSDGLWVDSFLKKKIAVTPFLPANCGWEVAWESWFLSKFEGVPLKGVEVWTDSSPSKIKGDLMVTQYGLEGTPIYTLTRALRAESNKRLWIDLKPDLSTDELRNKFKNNRGFLRDIEKSWKLTPLAKGLLLRSNPDRNLELFIDRVKALSIDLIGPRSIEEAISTAGGVQSQSLTEEGMIRDYPGLFCVGEMVDWEAPTGGYLLQGCFSGAAVVARGIEDYFKHKFGK